MSTKSTILAGLCAAILLAAASGCDSGSTTTGPQPGAPAPQAQRNKAMGDFMKNESQKTPAK